MARAGVAVAVVSVNDAPVAVDDSGPTGITAERDGRVWIEAPALLNNDTDTEGDALLLVAAQGVSHGSLQAAPDGRLEYIPEPGFVGVDQFRYTVSDGQASDEAVVDITVADPYIGWRQGSTDADVMSSNLLVENRVYADSGDDSVGGGLRNDRLEGGYGNDRLNGLSGDDQLGGGAGNDTLTGGTGNDVLDGGRGDDLLIGGWGADHFVFRRGDGNDDVVDFAPVHASGADHISISIPGIAGFNDLLQYARQTEEGVMFDFGEGDTMLIRGADLPSVQNDWFTFP